jgi:L-serine dehydratase
MPIETADDLLRHCRTHNLTIPQVVWQNERAWRSPEEIHEGLLRIWETMKQCVFRGCHTGGILPGGLRVVRRAAGMNHRLLGGETFDEADAWIEAIRHRGKDFQDILKWVSCFALAVNEENAAFGRVVTAPTNGAAGVIPAVLMYYICFCPSDTAGIESFLLTAGDALSGDGRLSGGDRRFQRDGGVRADPLPRRFRGTGAHGC